MNIRDLFRYSLKQLKAKKLETFLIVFAVSLCVLVLNTILSPTYQIPYTSKQNTDGYQVQVGPFFQTLANEVMNKTGLPLMRFYEAKDPNKYKLTLPLLEDIYKSVPGIDFYMSQGIASNPLRGYQLPAYFVTSNYSTEGVLAFTHLSPEAFTGLGFKLKTGSLYTKDDFLKNRTFLVLGSELAERLFPNENPVGKTIEVGNPRTPLFTVLGVIEPYQALDEHHNIKKHINQIAASSYTNVSSLDNKVTYNVVTFYPKKPTLEVFSKISSYLQRHYQGLYSVSATEAYIQDFNKEYQRSYIALSVIAGFLLVIACINIVNLLFIRIAKQHRAIGLNLALGATKRSIFYQYCFTSSLQGLTGSLLGILLLWLISLTKISQSFNIVFTGKNVLLGLGAGLLMSAAFGIYPAIVASQTSPAEALKSE
ncbi:MAG: ABC transporter permease [Firmicutes bacterium]|nr:ABC transporter permease [Bacillota bacterium]